MLSGIHFILTYTCNFECDHCFLYCSPSAGGTFTLEQVKKVFTEIKKIGTIDTICFEGGEPFLLYPLLLECVRIAHEEGYTTAIETNTYWATSEEDAILWLKPLKEAGLCLLEVSDDAFHHGDEKENTARHARSAAEELRLSVNTISIQPPSVLQPDMKIKGKPIYLGGPKMRGRAVDRLTEGLPLNSWRHFLECPFEDLRDPDRVHIDAFGHVQLCQGLSMGNMWETPLSDLIKNYEPDGHPIAGPLLKGGPAQLAKDQHLLPRPKYVDACHFCTHLCRSLIEKYPEFLGPAQVYGLNTLKAERTK